MLRNGLTLDAALASSNPLFPPSFLHHAVTNLDIQLAPMDADANTTELLLYFRARKRQQGWEIYAKFIWSGILSSPTRVVFSFYSESCNKFDKLNLFRTRRWNPIYRLIAWDAWLDFLKNYRSFYWGDWYQLNGCVFMFDVLLHILSTQVAWVLFSLMYFWPFVSLLLKYWLILSFGYLWNICTTYHKMKTKIIFEATLDCHLYLLRLLMLTFLVFDFFFLRKL